MGAAPSAIAPSAIREPSEENALLANYPNPFNPETWIPYQLSEPSEVTVSIYSVNGSLIRTLALGHQAAGVSIGAGAVRRIGTVVMRLVSVLRVVSISIR